MTKFALKNMSVIFMLMFAVAIFGTVSYFSIPREMTPDITIPVIVVSTVYPGVSPADIETLITDPLEKKLKGLSDLESIKSSSGESFSSIVLEFDTKVDIDTALQKVRDKVASAKSEMPADAKDSEIQEISFSDFPIMVVNISGPFGLVELKQMAETLQDDLEGIDGVLRVDLSGGRENEVQLLVDAKRLKAFGLTFDDVARTLKSENLTMPGGTIELGASNYMVRVPGEFSSISEIANTVVKAKFGTIVRLSDVAQISFTFKERESSARLAQQDSVSLAIIKRSGKNLISTAEQVKEHALKANLPKGVRVEILGDRSIDIANMVKELESNIFSGLILVALVLMFFMGLRNALIVAMAIPFSFGISIVILHLMGVSLNMVVLFSLIMALGMLVDNAIVVVENIYRLFQEGSNRMEAALTGANQMSIPILGSTATTLAAYAPMLFWPGIMGEFMKYLPITLITTLMASYFVAVVFNPVLTEKFMVLHKIRGKNSSHTERHNGPIMSRYKRALGILLSQRKWQVSVILGMVVIFVISLLSFSVMKKEFFPVTPPEQFYITVNTPPGTSLETTDKIVKIIEERLTPLIDIKRYVANVGTSGAGTSMFGGGGGSQPTYAQIVVDLHDPAELSQSSYEIQKQLRQLLSDIPGAVIKVDSPAMGPPSDGAPINVRLIGPEFEELNKLSLDIQRIMKRVDGVVDIRDDYNEGRPEIQVRIDRSKAALMGLSTYQIANTVRSAINGVKATTYRMNNEEYDVNIRLQDDQRASISDIGQLLIPSMKKDEPYILLSSVAKVETRGGLNVIPHYDLDRLITVQADVASTIRPPQAIALIKKEVSKLSLPSGYSVEYGGENAQMEESFAFLGKAFLAAVIAIFIILVAMFNSFIYPLIIGCTIILGVIGVALGLGITGNPFGMMAFIGMISLGGIVVNNAIVLIDYILHLRGKGYELVPAIINSGLTRFRPVMLTAITTVLGLIPLTFGLNFTLMPPFIKFTQSSNTAFWGPMGSVIIFGLTIATFFTLFVVPLLFYFADRLRTRFAK